MTYKQLIQIILEHPECLEQDITVSTTSFEFYPVESSIQILGSDVIDDGQLVLNVDC